MSSLPTKRTSAVALALAALTAAPALSQDCAPEPAVEAFVDSIRANDSAALNAMVLDSPEAIFFGTDGAERWAGSDAVIAAFDAQLAAFQTTGVDTRDMVVLASPECDAAVFSGIWEWRIAMGDQNVALEALRVTGTLFREGDDWRLTGFHFSMPVGGQAVPY